MLKYLMGMVHWLFIVLKIIFQSQKNTTIFFWNKIYKYFCITIISFLYSHLYLRKLILHYQYKYMKQNINLTTLQKTVLITLRILIGWHLLYEGISKLLIPNWSSASFLSESKWILSGFSNWIVTHSEILQIADFLNMWGLVAIGLGLIVGLFTRAAAISGAILLLIYYLNNPPLIGLEYTLPSEGSYLIVSKTLIEAVALFLLAVFPSGYYAGLDRILFGSYRSNHF